MVKTARNRQFSGIFQQKKKGSKSKELSENGVLGIGGPVEQVKRLAASPQEGEAPTRKRSAFGDITNAFRQQQAGKSKKSSAQKKPETGTESQNGVQRRKTRSSGDLPDFELLPSSGEVTSSQESSESSIDVLSDICSGVELTDSQKIDSSVGSEIDSLLKELDGSISSEQVENSSHLPPDVVDIDADKTDPFQVAEYAEEIFLNMKRRENLFPLELYMEKQKELTISMRAILVDWLVEVQESFELYHETLYLGVRVLDNYLMRSYVERENLQLVGAVSLYIACKVEERHPPCLDDFLYICDDAYQQKAFVAMEKKILNSLEFNINMPIPYRFLRRFAKVASADVKTLTLSRFILETTLHHYKFIVHKPSFLAAACLRLALRMKGCDDWTPTVVHYTGFSVAQLDGCVIELNEMISEPPKQNLMTVRNKYSHKVFHEVALIPPLDSLNL